MDPEVHVFREGRRAVEDRGLAADEEILHPEAVRASEEI
jgi:hypothetical protein